MCKSSDSAKFSPCICRKAVHVGSWPWCSWRRGPVAAARWWSDCSARRSLGRYDPTKLFEFICGKTTAFHSSFLCHWKEIKFDIWKRIYFVLDNNKSSWVIVIISKMEIQHISLFLEKCIKYVPWHRFIVNFSYQVGWFLLRYCLIKSKHPLAPPPVPFQW